MYHEPKATTGRLGEGIARTSDAPRPPASIGSGLARVCKTLDADREQIEVLRHLVGKASTMVHGPAPAEDVSKNEQLYSQTIEGVADKADHHHVIRDTLIRELLNLLGN